VSKPRRPDPDPLNPPAYRDSELALCGIAEHFPSCRTRLEHDTSPDDFAFPLIRKLRELILKVGAGGVEIPFRAVLQAWPPGEDPPEAVEQLFKDLEGFVARPEHWEWNHLRVKDASQRRRVAKEAEALMKAACNGHTPAEIVEAGTRLFREVLSADPEARRRCRPVDELLGDYAAGLGENKLRKLRTGLWSLDQAMDGIAPGEVLTVVARPQVGKSAIAGQIIVNCALEGVPSGFFSLEMPREQALERLLQTAWGLTRHQVENLARSGFKDLTPHQFTALESLGKNVAIVDRGKSNVADLEASFEEAVGTLGKPPRLAVVDYLGLMGSGAKNLPLYQRVSEAAVDLKSFSKRHHVTLVLLSQAGRDQDEGCSEGWKELGLDAARDSGQVEEAADFLVTLWRPELQKGLSAASLADVRGDLEGRLCKNRRGPRPYLHFHLDEARQRITDVAAGGGG